MTAYVQNKCIGKAGRLISDILNISDKLSIDGYLVTADIEKTFDSLDHESLLVVLKRTGFGNYFIEWIEILLTNQEFCVITDGTTTLYFNLEKGARQGDPISAYVFIIALKIIFAMEKSNPNIKGLNIFSHNYLYTAYADDTTFFLNDQKSISELMKNFKLLSKFSGLKLHILKCEVAGISSLKGVKMAVCVIKCIDLTIKIIEILAVHFSCNQKLKTQNIFVKSITNMQNVLSIWRMRNIILEGKIIFKTLALSKIENCIYNINILILRPIN